MVLVMLTFWVCCIFFSFLVGEKLERLYNIVSQNKTPRFFKEHQVKIISPAAICGSLNCQTLSAFQLYEICNKVSVRKDPGIPAVVGS